jgi:hypothetical protein
MMMVKMKIAVSRKIWEIFGLCLDMRGIVSRHGRGRNRVAV